MTENFLTLTMQSILVTLLLLVVQIGAVPPLHLCKQINACSCQYVDDGTILDLSSLGTLNGAPHFQNVKSPDGLFYSYSPCGSFAEGDCKDAAICLKSSAGETRTIGSATLQPQFTYDEITTDTVIGYTAGEIGETHTFVYLICDSSENPGPPTLFPNGTQDTGFYIMTLFTVCACGGGCDANGPISKSKHSSGLGIGVYILIGIAGIIILYFFIGSLIMKFGLKKRGKEIIPNSAFWCHLPTKMKDCSLWLFEKCYKGEDPYTNMK